MFNFKLKNKMRKILSFSLLAFLLLIGTNAWAEATATETITLSDQGYTNGQAVSSTSGTVVTLDYTDGTSTATAYYTTGNGVRVYYGGKMTVSASGLTITKVIVTFAKDKSPTISMTSNGTTSTGGTTSPATWTGSATEVYFNVADKGHARIQSVQTWCVVTASIAETGWTTFASSYILDLENITASTGTATAYYISAVGENATTVSTIAKISAGVGILLNGSNGATVSIPVLATGGSAISGNKLVGCKTSTPLTADASKYVLVKKGDDAVFKSLSEMGATIPAGKAYLDTGTAPAPSIIRLVDDETGATNIWNVEETTDKAVKFIENGKLYILRDGITYDALGRVVR